MRQQQGFTLIEVAISIFILSVGLLGLASLQFMSLKNMEMAQRSDSANVYLQEIAEAMRSNTGSLATFVAGSGNVGSNNAVGCETNCGYAVSAEAELNRIKNAIAQSFDTPQLKVSQESSLGSYSVLNQAGDLETVSINVYKIELKWKEPGSFILRKKNSETETQIQSLKVVL